VKEKEIDIYLSLVSWCQLAMLGVGGTLVSEIFADIPRFEVILISCLGIILIGIILIVLYDKLFSKINRDSL